MSGLNLVAINYHGLEKNSVRCTQMQSYIVKEDILMFLDLRSQMSGAVDALFRLAPEFVLRGFQSCEGIMLCM